MLKRKNSSLFFIPFVLLSLLFWVSCDDDDMVEEPVNLTINEQHRENLNSVNVGSFNIAYLEFGNANASQTIILLHGVPTSSFLYRNVGMEIAENTGFRVLVPDFLGFGASDKPSANPEYTFANQAQRIYDFASALNVDNFVLGVHDTGGLVAWMMLLDDEVSRIEGLLIADTELDLAGFIPPDLVLPIVLGEQTPEEAWGPLDDNPQLAQDSITNFMEKGVHDPTIFTDEILEGYILPVQESSEVYITIFEDLNNYIGLIPDIKTAAANFDKPVALIFALEDNYINADVTPAQLQLDFNIAEDDVLLFPETGHYLQEENPNAYIDFASQFLNDNF